MLEENYESNSAINIRFAVASLAILGAFALGELRILSQARANIISRIVSPSPDDSTRPVIADNKIYLNGKRSLM